MSGRFDSTTFSTSVAASSEIVELGGIGVECRCDRGGDMLALSPDSGSSPAAAAGVAADLRCVAPRRCVDKICVAVNEKDVCICTSRLSVDFHRRFVANVSHGY